MKRKTITLSRYAAIFGPLGSVAVLTYGMFLREAPSELVPSILSYTLIVFASVFGVSAGAVGIAYMRGKWTSRLPDAVSTWMISLALHWVFVLLLLLFIAPNVRGV